MAEISGGNDLTDLGATFYGGKHARHAGDDDQVCRSPSRRFSRPEW
jgi:hypothetical protein